MLEQTPIAPRLLTKAQAAAYCGVTLRNFDRLRKLGTFPDRVEGMLRWDIQALDTAIDRLSVGNKRGTEAIDPLEVFKRKRDERRAARKQAPGHRTPHRTPPPHSW